MNQPTDLNNYDEIETAQEARSRVVALHDATDLIECLMNKTYKEYASDGYAWQALGHDILRSAHKKLMFERANTDGDELSIRG